ncbi:division/cell wall cluster transcriptional repressor MraZ [Natrinema pallidum]|uniref:Uncharacterized protein n=1 Tax=Natrinema pallidum DSM 3751 TaxID=1227495 RepID=L9YGI7_9EURY|nr:hypothetical protein [Natrinema pallidum]ELY73209.1 hypothetical protein C487_17445 [Natrinema pallidum DSM 3751]
MTDRLEGLVTQVIEPDERGRFAIPAEIRDGVADDEDLIVVATDPDPAWARRIYDIPIFGSIIQAVVGIPRSALTLVPGIGRDDVATAEGVAAAHGTLTEGEWVTLEVRDAVVSETTARGDVLEREVHLRDILTVCERSETRPADTESGEVATVVDRGRST